MSVRQLPEAVVDLITDKIQAEINQALIDMRADRDDPRISTELPIKYYISERVDPFQTPAVFVIAKDIDFQKEARGANHVNARVSIQISLVCEDRVTEILTRRVYRYGGVLHTILDQAELTSANNKAKIILIVERSDFSPVFVSPGESGTFRKEVLLYITANVFENF